MLTLLTTYPAIGFAFLVAVIIALTVHEFAHAFVAYLYGDSTAEQMGRLSFNPLVHIDLTGALLFLLIGFGWGKPVPTNPLNFKKRKEGEILVALAGPLSNLFMALFAVIIFWVVKGFLVPTNLLFIFLILFFQINITLMIFNLIPVPPLDGSHILNNLLPDSYYKIKAYLMMYGPQTLFWVILIGMLLNINLFGWIGHIAQWFGYFFGMPTMI